MPASEFAGKSVLLTGATRGIGRAIAVLLAERGAAVTTLGGGAARIDLADAQATRKAAEDAMPVDYLVNCAGATTLESFLDTTVASFDHLVAVNTRAPMIVAQAYARSCIARGVGGAIVNVSSLSAFKGFADHAAYCASKGALDAMSRVMANELGRHAIRVNCVNPAITLTDMARQAWSAPERSAPMLARMPLGRFIEPAEVAEVVLFLLSARAAMITGVSLPVDAGFEAV